VASKKPKKAKKGKGQKGQKEEKKTPSRPKRKGIMSFIMGSEEKKGVLENVADFIHNLMKPSSNRQEKLLTDICNKLEGLNEKKATSVNDSPRNVTFRNDVDKSTNETVSSSFCAKETVEKKNRDRKIFIITPLKYEITKNILIKAILLINHFLSSL
jgi:hypothetical protein